VVTQSQGMAAQRRLQEEQYSFPYHYLPSYTDGKFGQHRHWSRGYQYLGRLEIAFDLLGDLSFRSLIDIGCGDGRFLAAVARRFPSPRLLGVDNSETAIRLAGQMSPRLQFEQRDVIRSRPDEQFDVATLLDVIEHIPPELLPAFMAAVARIVRPGGHIIVTAPHTNVPTISKHYQHFNSASLGNLLGDGFVDLRFVTFDHISRKLKALFRLMGGAGNYYIVTHAGLSGALFRYYVEHCLRGHDESRCQGIACIARNAATGATGQQE